MPSVAGAEIGVPHTIDDITPEWLTAAFRTSGAIGDDTVVSAVAAEAFAESTGLLSAMYWLTPTYDGPATDAPERVLAKLESPDPAQRGLAEGLGFYNREMMFYREMADEVPFRVPVAHAAIHDPEAGVFALVMEDFSGLRTVDQQAGVGIEDALRSARNQARFHATFHEDPRLEALQELYPPILNPVYLAALPGIFAAGWVGVLEYAPDDLITPEVKAFGDNFGAYVPFFLETFMNNMTLIHGDWRADNLFYESQDPSDDNDTMALIDFQIMGQGSGIYDLAYFASQSIAGDQRSGRDLELIDAYLTELEANGVTRDRDEAIRQYRLGLAHCLIYAVASFQSYAEFSEVQHGLMQSMLRRAVEAVKDMNSLELLPEL